MKAAELPPVSRIDWPECYRIIPSRFPPVGLFDEVADPADLDAVYYLEGLTNPRLRQELGQIDMVPRERRISGPGSTPIMAAFTHLNPDGSRFSDGSYGVYYAGRERETSIRETVHHRERFLSATQEPSCDLDLRCYAAALDANLHDIRGGWPQLHDPHSYAVSQHFARTLREAGSDGIVYDSVCHTGRHCVAVFYPDRLSDCRQQAHLNYRWNGSRIDRVVVAGEVLVFQTSIS